MTPRQASATKLPVLLRTATTIERREYREALRARRTGAIVLIAYFLGIAAVVVAYFVGRGR